MMDHLARASARTTVNILLAHVLVDDAKVGGPESGERELHMGEAYVIKPPTLPVDAAVHRPRSRPHAAGLHARQRLVLRLAPPGRLR